MPPDLQLLKQWLHRARSDLRSAEVLLGNDPPLCEEAGFHCQQSIEKALKAFLVHREIPFDWSHQIGYLLDLCRNVPRRPLLAPTAMVREEVKTIQQH